MNNGGGHSPPYGVIETTWKNAGQTVPTIIAVSFVKKTICVIEIPLKSVRAYEGFI